MKYGFIGCGNMGGALALAVSKSSKDIILCDKDTEKAEALASKIGASVGSIQNVINKADRIFLGVKPQVIEETVKNVKDLFAKNNPLIISMAAGVEIKTLEGIIGKLPIIRIMPNTPVAVGKGMIVFCHNELVDEKTVEDFTADMQYSGTVTPIAEKLIDAACAVTGCGPAYAYMFIDALADGAVACGISRADAVKYAAAMLSGSAEMVLMSGKHPAELKDNVCSPGGSTICGVKALEEGNFRATCIDAVNAAYKRTKELGKK